MLCTDYDQQSGALPTVSKDLLEAFVCSLQCVLCSACTIVCSVLYYTIRCVYIVYVHVILFFLCI